ncbi:MAG: hypothetical protein LBL91_05560 [Lachnospiraceae bacterium]|jgi:hypothetical protein|nr:hypothetical protein [Lachnospiraceae bacterium]
MGGESYGRDVYSSYSTSNGSGSSSSWGASSIAAAKISSTKLDSSMNPTGKNLRSTTKNPIIIVLDETGSNIDLARLLYDKLPMFYGQIEQKKYFDDFDISICAVGDAYTDSYPLQVSPFAKGIELDSYMEKLVLEGGGGGNNGESYELMAYYLTEKTEFAPGAKPIVFFIGDEPYHPKVNKGQAEKFDLPFTEPIDPFPNLRKKFNDNVYMLLNRFCGRDSFDSKALSQWTKALAPEHLIKISEEKAVVDLMLGILALLAKRSLKTYAIDMQGRGQTIQRIEGVTKALEGLSTAIVPAEQIKTLPTTIGTATSADSKKGKRI